MDGVWLRVCGLVLVATPDVAEIAKGAWGMSEVRVELVSDGSILGIPGLPPVGRGTGGWLGADVVDCRVTPGEYWVDGKLFLLAYHKCDQHDIFIVSEAS